MMKIVKKLFKIVAAIIGAYLAFNTFLLAKMGASRIVRQIRLQHEDLSDMSIGEAICAVDIAALEEEEREWEAWKEFTDRK